MRRRLTDQWNADLNSQLSFPRISLALFGLD
jgi:hypothetical protein